MNRFKAIWITKDDGAKRQNPPSIQDIALDDLMEGDVVIRVVASSLNYKDGLALTGKSPVIRRFPMIPGIDLAGQVESCQNGTYAKGDWVILNGWGLGEVHMGAYGEYARVNSNWLIPLPEGMTPKQAMAIGTAGYTAMLAVLALEKNGLSPTDGPVLVTGAAGGVGSVAVALLAQAGFEVVASTGRAEESEYLKQLGAREILPRSELSGPAKPIGKEIWAGAIDVAGGDILANILASTRRGGGVASCGLAQSMNLPTSVAPFILRGVSLLGIDSVMAAKDLRLNAYRRLATGLDFDRLDAMTSELALSAVIDHGDRILSGKVRGRIIVNVE